MRLNDPLVTSFSYDGEEYAIDLAFDNVLDVLDVFDEEDLRGYEKADLSLELLLDKPCDENKVIDLWEYVYNTFIRIESKQPIEYDRKGNPMPVQKERKQSVDFNKDAEYIFASFQQAYGMNLFEQQGKLSWSEFRALLSGLPSDTIMQRIIQIRLWEPSKNESGEYKQAMRELQKNYALEEIEEE